MFPGREHRLGLTLFRRGLVMGLGFRRTILDRFVSARFGFPLPVGLRLAEGAPQKGGDILVDRAGVGLLLGDP